MKKNVGGIDRVLRIVVGLFVTSLVFWGPKSLWALLGLIPLVTGFIGWCGLYGPLGISTCERQSSDIPKAG